MKGAAKTEDREIVSFGLFMLIADAEQLLILVMIAVLFDLVPAMAPFVLFYSALRRYSGGGHAKTHAACICIYTGTASLAAWTGVHTADFIPRPVLPFLLVAATVIVFLKAPVAHPDNPKPAAMMKRFREVSCIVILGEVALILTGCAFLPAWWDVPLLCAALGGCIASITLLLPMPQGKGVKT